MQGMPEIRVPVYLFTGFLEAGKTRFIQQTLEDKRFNTGDRTLIILCEEGEEELDVSKMSSKDVKVVTIEDESELTEANISRLCDEADAQRILIEYNGMWQMNTLFNALPADFGIYQEICIADATTFENYNANIRSLVVDKLQTAELIIFNRYDKSIDMMTLHKICRGVSRGINIAYEYTDGRVQYDDIEDPLPFDVNADKIVLDDKDFALWYRDIMEEPKKYVGKTMTFKGIVAVDKAFPENTFAVGRHVMTCCIEDIQYMGLAAEWTGVSNIKSRDWIKVTGVIAYEKNKLYRGKGPVLKVSEVSMSTPPKQEVATFF
ncbi:TIGR03943 family protein [Ruminococcus sp. NK3A76]|uniref:TIGR03943 family putative permease subunit n=1 Tax=Ruminococcus sp. NK3A76 TaxID=877411 RepID=UPI000A71C6F0|nr:TIGR03943 family protein [Ruminococcus sp. NK3A76]